MTSARGLASFLEPPHPAARLFPITAAAILIASLGAWTVRDARARRRARDAAQPEISAAARVAGPELAVHSGSRWLRHPTRAEPWAALNDGPAVLDLDPAGAFASPPRATLRAGLPAVSLTVRRSGP